MEHAAGSTDGSTDGRQAEEQAVDASRRVSIRVRACLVLSAQGLSLLAVPARDLPVAVAAFVVAALWSGWLVARLDRAGSYALFVVDTALVAALVAAQPVLDVPVLVAQGGGWAQMVAVTVVVGHHWQFPELRMRTQVWSASAIGVAFALGAGAVTGYDPAAVIEPGIWILAVSLFSRAVFELLRTAVRRVDDAGEAHARQETRAELARARRAAAQEHFAALHDTAAATLTVVGQGSLAAGDPRLAAQAGRDLQVLRAPETEVAPGADLTAALAEVVAESGLPVERSVTGVPGPVPPGVVAAFTGALREALLNVERHAGGRGAHLHLDWQHGAPVVEIRNDTDPVAGPADAGGRGLRHSILERMQRVGGRAAVTSAGGEVRVRLEWSPLVEPSGTPHPLRPPLSVGVVRRRFRLAMTLVLAIVITRAAVTDLNADWRWQLAAFGVLAACVPPAVRSPRTAAARYLILAVAVAAGVVLTATIAAPELMGAQHTSWRITGYFVVLLFADVALSRVMGLLLVVTAVTFVQFGLAGRLDRPGIVLFASTVIVNLAAQLSAALAVRILERLAAVATRLTEEDARLRTVALVADQLQVDRVERYRDVAGTAVPLLEGLRGGELSPADPVVQQRASVEAARLRRLMAEGDEVSDPLVHELRACVDAAQRAGVRVDVAVRGRGPALAVRERRRLTEPVIEVLFRTRSRARVILIAEPRDVTVSIVADVDDGDWIPGGGGTGPPPEIVRSGDRLWVTARWSDPLTTT